MKQMGHEARAIQNNARSATSLGSYEEGWGNWPQGGPWISPILRESRAHQETGPSNVSWAQASDTQWSHRNRLRLQQSWEDKASVQVGQSFPSPAESCTGTKEHPLPQSRSLGTPWHPATLNGTNWLHHCDRSCPSRGLELGGGSWRAGRLVGNTSQQGLPGPQLPPMQPAACPTAASVCCFVGKQSPALWHPVDTLQTRKALIPAPTSHRPLPRQGGVSPGLALPHQSQRKYLSKLPTLHTASPAPSQMVPATLHTKVPFLCNFRSFLNARSDRADPCHVRCLWPS